MLSQIILDNILLFLGIIVDIIIVFTLVSNSIVSKLMGIILGIFQIRYIITYSMVDEITGLILFIIGSVAYIFSYLYISYIIHVESDQMEIDKKEREEYEKMIELKKLQEFEILYNKMMEKKGGIL